MGLTELNGLLVHLTVMISEVPYFRVQIHPRLDPNNYKHMFTDEPCARK